MSEAPLRTTDRKLRAAASPRARRLMRELLVDPQAVHGTGPGGRVVEADVRRAALGNAMAAAPQPLSAAATRPSPTPQPHPAPQPRPLPQPSPLPRKSASSASANSAAGTSSMRRAIARLTTASATGVPQFSVRAEADAAALVACREQLLDHGEADSGARISYTDFLLRAQAMALSDLPAACATWQDDALIAAESVDLGLVVNVPGGLMIPILKHADSLSLIDLAEARTELIQAARAGRLGSDRLSGGVSSLSNLGSSRVDDFSALVAPPQSTILAVGRLATRPYVKDGQLVARATLRLTLSVDHRVMDGALAADLLGRIVELIEKPALLIYR